MTIENLRGVDSSCPWRSIVVMRAPMILLRIRSRPIATPRHLPRPGRQALPSAFPRSWRGQRRREMPRGPTICLPLHLLRQQGTKARPRRTQTILELLCTANKNLRPSHAAVLPTTADAGSQSAGVRSESVRVARAGDADIAAPRQIIFAQRGSHAVPTHWRAAPTPSAPRQNPNSFRLSPTSTG